jgi:hypothetical protein
MNRNREDNISIFQASNGKLNFKKLVWITLLVFILACVLTGIIIYAVGYTDVGGYHSITSDAREGIGFWDTAGRIAAGILSAILGVVIGIVAGIVGPVMNAMQDAIVIMFNGKIIYQAFHITYKQYISISLIVFAIMMIINLFISYTMKKSEQPIFIGLVKAFIMLLSLPIGFTLLFAITQQLGIWLFGQALSDVSIYEMIKAFTIDLIGETTSTYEKLALNIIYVISVMSVFIYFGRFVIGLAIRMYEVIVFGIIGLPFAAASSINEDGGAISTWISVMITKITNAFFCLLGYFLVLQVLPLIIENIMVTQFEVHLSSLLVIRIMNECSY